MAWLGLDWLFMAWIIIIIRTETTQLTKAKHTATKVSNFIQNEFEGNLRR